MRVIFKQNAKDAKEVIEGCPYLEERMVLVDGFVNVWEVDDELIRRDGDAFKFIETFIDSLVCAGVEWVDYYWEPSGREIDFKSEGV